MRYRITTLGCRVNHAETRELESVLLARGFVSAAPGAHADLEVIHSCSVTGSAAAKSRQAIRRASRRARSHELCPQSSRHEHTGLSVNRNGPESLHAADQARQRRSPPSAPTFSKSPQIIVTGCYGSTDPDEAALLAGGRDHVIQHEADDGSTLAERFALRVDQWLTTQQAPGSLRTPAPDSCRQTIRPLPVVTPRPAAGSHVRAELKIQDGCDAHCTFCIIPKIRRTLRSKAIPDAVAEATRLVELGHREIVLTGIFIGAYGHETALRRKQSRAGTSPLADLLDAVAQVPGLSRLRVSSMEPGDVSEPLLDAMIANQRVVVPHLHLPLQSGSDAILRPMNRQYRVGDYLEMIDRVNAALTLPAPRERTSLHVRSDPPNEFGGSYKSECRPGGPYGALKQVPGGPYGALKQVTVLPPAITTDIICGFPGETDDDFERTVEVALRVGYLHMHVFPYSARRGTAAARWRDRFVAPPVIRSRVRRLIDLENDPDDGLSIRYRRRLLGRTVRVIIEQPARPGVMTGRCDHYALLSMETDRPRGALLTAEVTSVTPDETTARPADISVPLPVLV